MEERAHRNSSPSSTPSKVLPVVERTESPPTAKEGSSSIAGKRKTIDKWSEEFWQRAFQSKDKPEETADRIEGCDADEEYLLRLAARKPVHRKQQAGDVGRARLFSRSADSSPKPEPSVKPDLPGLGAGPSRAQEALRNTRETGSPSIATYRKLNFFGNLTEERTHLGPKPRPQPDSEAPYRRRSAEGLLQARAIPAQGPNMPAPAGGASDPADVARTPADVVPTVKELTSAIFRNVITSQGAGDSLTAKGGAGATPSSGGALQGVADKAAAVVASVVGGGGLAAAAAVGGSGKGDMPLQSHQVSPSDSPAPSPEKEVKQVVVTPTAGPRASRAADMRGMTPSMHNDVEDLLGHVVGDVLVGKDSPPGAKASGEGTSSAGQQLHKRVSLKDLGVTATADAPDEEDVELNVELYRRVAEALAAGQRCVLANVPDIRDAKQVALELRRTLTQKLSEEHLPSGGDGRAPAQGSSSLNAPTSPVAPFGKESTRPAFGGTGTGKDAAVAARLTAGSPDAPPPPVDGPAPASPVVPVPIRNPAPPAVAASFFTPPDDGWTGMPRVPSGKDLAKAARIAVVPPVTHTGDVPTGSTVEQASKAHGLVPQAESEGIPRVMSARELAVAARLAATAPSPAADVPEAAPLVDAPDPAPVLSGKALATAARLAATTPPALPVKTVGVSPGVVPPGVTLPAATSAKATSDAPPGGSVVGSALAGGATTGSDGETCQAEVVLPRVLSGKDLAKAARAASAAPAPPAAAGKAFAAAAAPSRVEPKSLTKEVAGAAKPTIPGAYVPDTEDKMPRVPSNRDLAVAARLAVVPPAAPAVAAPGRDVNASGVQASTPVLSASPADEPGKMPRVLSTKDLAVAARIAATSPATPKVESAGATGVAAPVSPEVEVPSVPGVVTLPGGDAKMPRVPSRKELGIAARLAVSPPAPPDVKVAVREVVPSAGTWTAPAGEVKMPRVLSNKDLATVARLNASAPAASTNAPARVTGPPATQPAAKSAVAVAPKGPTPGEYVPSAGDGIPRVPSGKDLATAARIAVVPSSAPGGRPELEAHPRASKAGAAVTAAVGAIGGAALTGRDLAKGRRLSAIMGGVPPAGGGSAGVGEDLPSPQLVLPLRLSCGADKRVAFVRTTDAGPDGTLVAAKEISPDKDAFEGASKYPAANASPAAGVEGNPMHMWAAYLGHAHPHFAEEARAVADVILGKGRAIVSPVAEGLSGNSSLKAVVATLKATDPALARRVEEIGPKLLRQGSGAFTEAARSSAASVTAPTLGAGEPRRTASSNGGTGSNESSQAAGFASLLGAALGGANSNLPQSGPAGPAAADLARRPSVTPTHSFDTELDGRKGLADESVALGYAVPPSGSGEPHPKGWPVPTPHVSMATPVPVTPGLTAEGPSDAGSAQGPKLEGLEDALRSIVPEEGSPVSAETVEPSGKPVTAEAGTAGKPKGVTVVPLLKLPGMTGANATQQSGASAAPTMQKVASIGGAEGILPRLQIGGTDGTPARVLGAEVDTRAAPPRLPSLGLNFPGGAGRSATASVVAELPEATEVAAPKVGKEESPKSLAIASRLQALASQGQEIAAAKPTRAPSASLDAALAKEASSAETTQPASKAASKEDDPAAPPSAATVPDEPAPEEAGRRPSIRDRLATLTKSFHRPSGRNEMSKDKLGAGGKGESREDGATPQQPPGGVGPTTSTRAPSGNLDALVTAREVGKPAVSDGSMSADRPGEAGGKVRVGARSLSDSAEVVAPAGGKAGGGVRGRSVSDVVEAGGRNRESDAPREQADVEDILASSTSQGESRRWSSVGGLRTYSLLSTETDDLEALLEEFEPVPGNTADLLDAEVALTGAKSTLDKTAEALERLEAKGETTQTPTADVTAVTAVASKGSVLTGFAWRRSGSTSAPRPASVAEETSEKLGEAVDEAQEVGGKLPAALAGKVGEGKGKVPGEKLQETLGKLRAERTLSSSGSSPVSRDMPQVPPGNTERLRDEVFEKILSGGGSARTKPSASADEESLVTPKASTAAAVGEEAGAAVSLSTGVGQPLSGEDVLGSIDASGVPGQKSVGPEVDGESAVGVAGIVGGAVAALGTAAASVGSGGRDTPAGLGVTEAAPGLGVLDSEVDPKKSLMRKLSERMGFTRTQSSESSQGSSPAPTPKASTLSTPSALAWSSEGDTAAVPSAPMKGTALGLGGTTGMPSMLSTPKTEDSSSMLDGDKPSSLDMASVVKEAGTGSSGSLTTSSGPEGLELDQTAAEIPKKSNVKTAKKSNLKPSGGLVPSLTLDALVKPGGDRLVGGKGSTSTPDAGLSGSPEALVSLTSTAPAAAGGLLSGAAAQVPAQAPDPSRVAALAGENAGTAKVETAEPGKGSSLAAVVKDGLPEFSAPKAGITPGAAMVKAGLPEPSTQQAGTTAGAAGGLATLAAGSAALAAGSTTLAAGLGGKEAGAGVVSGTLEAGSPTLAAGLESGKAVAGDANDSEGAGKAAGGVYTSLLAASVKKPALSAGQSEGVWDPFAASSPLLSSAGGGVVSLTANLGAQDGAPGSDPADGPAKGPSATAPLVPSTFTPTTGKGDALLGDLLGDFTGTPTAGQTDSLLDPKKVSGVRDVGGTASLVAPHTPGQKEVIPVAVAGAGKDMEMSPLPVRSLLDELSVQPMVAAPREISRGLDFFELSAAPKVAPSQGHESAAPVALKQAASRSVPLEADLLGLGPSAPSALPQGATAAVSDGQAGAAGEQGAGEEQGVSWEDMKGGVAPLLGKAYTLLGTGLTALSVLLDDVSREDEGTAAQREAAAAEEQDFGKRAGAALKKAAKASGRTLSAGAKSLADVSSSAGDSFTRAGRDTPDGELAAGVAIPLLVILLLGLTWSGLRGAGGRPAITKGASGLPAQQSRGLFGGYTSSKPKGFDPTAAEPKRGWWGTQPPAKPSKAAGKKGKSSAWFGKAPEADELVDATIDAGSWWGGKTKAKAKAGGKSAALDVAKGSKSWWGGKGKANLQPAAKSGGNVPSEAATGTHVGKKPDSWFGFGGKKEAPVAASTPTLLGTAEPALTATAAQASMAGRLFGWSSRPAGAPVITPLPPPDGSPPPAHAGAPAPAVQAPEVPPETSGGTLPAAKSPGAATATLKARAPVPAKPVADRALDPVTDGHVETARAVAAQKAEEERRAKDEAVKQAEEEVARKAQEEAERKAAEKKLQEQKEAEQKAEEERKEAERQRDLAEGTEAANKQKAAELLKQKQEQEAAKMREQQRKDAEEADRKAKEEAKAEAAKQAQEQADALAAQQAAEQLRAKEEAEEKARNAAAQQLQAKQEAEEKARKDAAQQLQAKQEAEEKARKDAAAQLEAEAAAEAAKEMARQAAAAAQGKQAAAAKKAAADVASRGPLPALSAQKAAVDVASSGPLPTLSSDISAGDAPPGLLATLSRSASALGLARMASWAAGPGTTPAAPSDVTPADGPRGPVGGALPGIPADGLGVPAAGVGTLPLMAGGLAGLAGYIPTLAGITGRLPSYEGFRESLPTVEGVSNRLKKSPTFSYLQDQWSSYTGNTVREKREGAAATRASGTKAAGEGVGGASSGGMFSGLPTLESVRACLPSTESLPDVSAYMPTLEGMKARLPPMDSLPDVSAYVPTLEGMKARLPSSDSLPDVSAYVPTLDGMKARLPSRDSLPDVSAYVPTYAGVMDQLSLYLPTQPAADGSKRAGKEAAGVSAYMPTLEGIKARLPSAESLPDISAYVRTLAGIKARLPSTASLPDVSAYVPTYAGVMGQLSAYLPSQPAAGGSKTAAKDAIGMSAYVPTLEGIRARLPSTDSLPDVSAYVPTLEGIKGRLPSTDSLPDVSAYVATLDGLKSYLPSTQGLKDVSAYVATLEGVKARLPSTDSLPDVSAYVPTYAGLVDRLQGAGAYLPTQEAVRAAMPSYAGLKDGVQSMSAYLPSVDGIKSALPTLPTFGGKGDTDAGSASQGDATVSFGGVAARVRSLSSGLPSFQDLKARLPGMAGAAGGLNVLERLPTMERARSYIPTAKSLPTWEAVRAQVAVTSLPASVRDAYVRLLSFGSGKATSALGAASPTTSAVPSWADMKARAAALGAGWTLPSLPAGDTGSMLPSLEGLKSRLGSLVAAGPNVGALYAAVPSAKGMEAGLQRGLSSLGGYGRRAVGVGADTHDAAVGTGLVVAVVVAILLALKQLDKPSAASDGEVGAGESLTAAARAAEEVLRGAPAVSRGLPAAGEARKLGGVAATRTRDLAELGGNRGEGLTPDGGEASLVGGAAPIAVTARSLPPLGGAGVAGGGQAAVAAPGLTQGAVDGGKAGDKGAGTMSTAPSESSVDGGGKIAPQGTLAGLLEGSKGPSAAGITSRGILPTGTGGPADGTASHDGLPSSIGPSAAGVTTRDILPTTIGPPAAGITTRDLASLPKEGNVGAGLGEVGIATTGRSLGAGAGVSVGAVADASAKLPASNGNAADAAKPGQMVGSKSGSSEIEDAGPLVERKGKGKGKELGPGVSGSRAPALSTSLLSAAEAGLELAKGGGSRPQSPESAAEGVGGVLGGSSGDSLAALSPGTAAGHTDGTPNAWGILAQRWGAGTVDPAKVAVHPQDAVYKKKPGEAGESAAVETAPTLNGTASGGADAAASLNGTAVGAASAPAVAKGDADVTGHVTGAQVTSANDSVGIKPRGDTLSAPSEGGGGSGFVGTLLGLVRSASRKAVSDTTEVDMQSAAVTVPTPTVEPVRTPTVEADVAPTDLDASATAPGGAQTVVSSAGEQGAPAVDGAAPAVGAVGRPPVLADAAGAEAGKAAVVMPENICADLEMRLRSAPPDAPAPIGTGPAATQAEPEALPVSTKAQAGDVDGEEADANGAAGIGRYRVGADDPVSQKVAAELQASAGKTAVGGGRYVANKSSQWRMASGTKKPEGPADAARGGCWGCLLGQ